MVLFLAAAGLWWFYERLRINQILDDPGRSRIEKIELSTNVCPLGDDLVQTRSELVRQEIEYLKDRIDHAITTKELEDLEEPVSKLAKSNPAGRQSLIEELRGQLMHKHEALLFTQLKAAFESGAANLQTLARVYTEKFPGGPHKSNVDDYIKKHWDDQMRKRDRYPGDNG